MTDHIPIETITKKILLIRGMKVIADRDLATLYGVTTKRLNEQVRRNKNRFPSDFRFQLNKQEKEEVVANCDHLSSFKYSPALPHVFTEHGAIMAASVLNSPQAIETSVFVVRAFIQMREILSSSKKFANKLQELEKHLGEHDGNFEVVFQALKQLLHEDEKPKRKIGF